MNRNEPYSKASNVCQHFCTPYYPGTPVQHNLERRTLSAYGPGVRRRADQKGAGIP